MTIRRIFAASFVLLLCLSQLSLSQTSNPARNTVSPSDSTDAFTTAYDYTVTFYPRWFTFFQGSFGTANQMKGPERISPLYHAVVAINDDTLYATTFVAVKDEPVIVTVPPTMDIYSVLQLDQYGNVFSGIPGNVPEGGVYGLIGPGWQGTLPQEITPIQIPYNNSVLIFRADKYSPDGADMREEAAEFRRNIHVATLTAYQQDANAGQTMIVPEAVFAFPFKGLAVSLIANHPIVFLGLLQAAVVSKTTQPLSPEEQTLSNNFNALFSDSSNYPQLIAGLQAAHTDIDANYLSHTLPNTTWINFTNIGHWDQTFQGYLDRSGITDYIQYGNDHAAAAYYHAFLDGNGNQLDGSAHAYVLTFKKGQQPDVSRFWSLTAYLPVSIELVPNSANKYVVAKYTPGLYTAPDDSVSIVMSVTRPQGVPKANWLPIPSGPFNVLLRAYGPQGTVEDNTYVPPSIKVFGK